MRDELDKKLCAKYPKMFIEREMPMSQTCMCWGFAHGDGWYNIIDQLCHLIQWHIDQSEEAYTRAKEYEAMREDAIGGDWRLFDEKYKDYQDKPDYVEAERKRLLEETPHWLLPKDPVPQVVVEQVKEKFGTLRFYYRGGDSFIRGLVSMAEAMTEVTCEECGNPGKLLSGGWVRTLCRKHAEELKYDWVEEDEDEQRV